jgi:hypothetical protein
MPMSKKIYAQLLDRIEELERPARIAKAIQERQKEALTLCGMYVAVNLMANKREPDPLTFEKMAEMQKMVDRTICVCGAELADPNAPCTQGLGLYLDHQSRKYCVNPFCPCKAATYVGE